jgi:ABC-2 type transport system permease protein
MTAIAMQTVHMTARDIRAFIRQPFYLIVTLIQPVIWLLLFGKLLSPVMAHGASTASYIAFLAPGVVAMTALFASGWSGMVFVSEMQQGTLNRFLVTPARRGALISGRLNYQAITVVIQSVIILLIGLAAGARYPAGIGILAVFLLCGAFLAMAFSSLSNAIGLLTRSAESVIGVAQFLVLPLAFLSSAFVPRNLMPGWISAIATYNPVNWLIEVGRESLVKAPAWHIVLTRGAGLLALAVICGYLSTLAFRAYQRSV